MASLVKLFHHVTILYDSGKITSEQLSEEFNNMHSAIKFTAKKGY
jgi:hypothetical protein